MLLTAYQISRISEKPFSRYLTVAILCSDLYMSSYDEFYQAMTLTKDSVLWNGLPQSDNIASPTFSEKNRNPLNLSLYLHLSNVSDLILRQFKNA
jgi:hypothetical protein